VQVGKIFSKDVNAGTYVFVVSSYSDLYLGQMVDRGQQLPCINRTITKYSALPFYRKKHENWAEFSFLMPLLLLVDSGE